MLKIEVLPDIWSLIEPYFTSDPDRLALTSTKVKMTYRQLKESVDKLSSILQASLPESYKQAQKRCLILHQPNSVSVILSMLTCVYMRQPFTPMPVDWPEEKERMVLEDVKGAVVITTKDRLSTNLLKNGKILATIKAEEISVEKEEDIFLVHVDEFEGQVDIADDCCYTIYTSGSTGRPKGVQCVRSGVSNMARGSIEVMGMTKEDVSGQFASVAFDAIIFEVFVALVSGGTLAVIGADERLGLEFEETVAELKISTLTLVPSLLEVLDPANFPTITKVVTEGEASTKELARKWSNNGKIRVINGYGPAENTVCASMYRTTEEILEGEDGDSHSLPIGKPIRGVYIRLLDENLKEVPVGQEGEICIGGQSLAKGYIGHASKLNDSHFIQDPIDPSARLYRTGDLAVKDARGDLNFLGRVDYQIKIRGQMVNLTGIETVLHACPGVEHASVVCQEGSRLVAFLSPKTLDIDEIQTMISSQLSPFEMPNAFRLMDSEDFPRNSNDKIDKKVLEKMPVDSN